MFYRILHLLVKFEMRFRQQLHHTHLLEPMLPLLLSSFLILILQSKAWPESQHLQLSSVEFPLL
jgi:hypothetical protein